MIYFESSSTYTGLSLFLSSAIFLSLVRYTLSGKKDLIRYSTIAQQRIVQTLPFPLVISPATEANDLGIIKEWIKNNQKEVLDSLSKYKGILLRGFSVGNHEAFHQIVEATGLSGSKYLFFLRSVGRKFSL